ncbi:hypothetical protein K1T71_014339 [Dendrolimus kikuchii]|uniref:Uncharacterized protein n=1 Tax=Dendrolimus kikuchii TaxID=765133 RepID=A0ACC1CDS4_9NEOP|nr:hypothetical protein K1T71_014339 [Dendrolimus kikuchii]
MSEVRFTQKAVRCALLSLDVKKSSSPDGNPAIVLQTSAAVPSRSVNDGKKAQPLGSVTLDQGKMLPSVHRSLKTNRSTTLRYCVSCPNIIPESRMKPHLPPRHFSPLKTKPVVYDTVYLNCPYLKLSATPLSPSSILPPTLLQRNLVTTKRNYSKPSDSPYPPPCGPRGCKCGCGCLPPLCNQPPKCIQYMTGYYYYPYDYWFCGPYRVSGTCVPVGPCGPCPPPKCPTPPLKCPTPPPPPPPCCICPAASAVMGVDAPFSSKSTCKSNIISSNQMQPPGVPRRESTPPRTGIAKINVTVTPGSTKTPPSMSSCAYSTQTSVHNPDKEPVPKSNELNTSLKHYQTISSRCSSPKPISKIPPRAFPRSLTNYEEYMKNKSPVCDKRSNSPFYEGCPSLQRPKVIQTREQRDKPKIYPDAFDYSSVPNYKSPYPQPFQDLNFKAYES